MKSLPWKRFSEHDSLFAALGALGGLRLIDVACGEGYYSRLFRDAGAEVVGVDVSQEMIRLAREHEAHAPRGIRYEVADAADLESFVARTGLGDFDLAVAQWLLDYADTRAMLRAMCGSLARVVRPGGRFVHLGGCFASILAHPERFREYGMQVEVLESCGDGSRIRWTVRGDGGSVSAENTMWTPPTITAEVEAAGFVAVEWPRAIPCGEPPRVAVDLSGVQRAEPDWDYERSAAPSGEASKPLRRPYTGPRHRVGSVRSGTWRWRRWRCTGRLTG